MRTADGVRALALTTPVVNNHSFLNQCCEPTINMIDWYYRTSPTEEIGVRSGGENSWVIDITDKVNGRVVSRSFTIGKKTKSLIYKEFIFYHPMETSQ